METLTLEELKAQNAADEVETETPQVEDKTELEAGEETGIEPEQVAEPEEGEEKEEEPEAWQLGDEQGSQDDVTVPVAAHARMRAKLKGALGEKDQEIEQLKAQVQKLASGSSQTPSATVKPRPRPEQFGTDEEYENALDVWYDKRVAAQVDTRVQTTQQTYQQQQEAQAVEQAVNQHYVEAARLAQASDIKPEVYQQADLAFRSVIDRVIPGGGDAITDNLISRMANIDAGGSAKVAYYVGRNAKAQSELEDSLRRDPTGIQAALYLGRKMVEIANPTKKVSQAPAPAASATGNSVVTTEKGLKKAYEKADKAGNAQARWDARMAAKKAGIDVSKW